MVRAFDYVSVQVIDAESCYERYSLAAEGAASTPAQRKLALPLTHMRLRLAPIGRVYAGVKAVARLLVVVLWLFPVLLVAKLVLRLVGLWYGDLITLAFVLLVVALFGCLSLLALLHLLAGSRSQRGTNATVRFAAPKSDVLAAARRLGRPLPRAQPDLPQLATAPGQSGRPISLSGVVVAGKDVPGAEPLVREQWHESSGRLVRTVEAYSFAVVAEGQPTVVVELQAAPTLVGRYRDSPAAEGAFARPPTRLAPLLAFAAEQKAPIGADSAVASAELVAGQRVEILAYASEPVPRLEELRVAGRPLMLAAEHSAGPYRSGDSAPAVLIRCDAQTPLLVRPAS
jgi:hypothetical protein